jgi:4-alpha-glucanotransferase
MQIEPHLSNLAKTAGLALSWIDAFGNPRFVNEDTVRSVLNALGFDCNTPSQCMKSQIQLEWEHNHFTLPPLMTGQVDSRVKFAAGLPFHGKPYRIVLESGEKLDGRFNADVSSPLETVPLREAGYHRLYIEDKETTLAIAPPKCFGVADHLIKPERKVWAPCVQLYSLKSKGDGGLGHYSALAEFASAAGKAGASALAISPVHAMFSADAYRYSPYGPSSRVFLNAMHIDPAAVLGDQGLNEAMHTLGKQAEQLKKLEKARLIDWQASWGLRLKLLRQLFIQFERDTALQKAFSEFRLQGGAALEQHAIYEALHEKLRDQEGDDWRRWPVEYSNPSNTEVRKFAQDFADEVTFHTFLQWQVALGLQRAQQSAREAGMPIGLIADMAIGADPQGSQAWMRREQFLQGLTIGAPPDIFIPQGQSWGINALSSHGMQQHGFQAYIEMLRASFQYAGGMRIDHVLGLFRLWLVPEGGSACDGVYLHYPTDDLIRLISLESHRHRAIVIGEDLGTVPQGTSNRLSQAGIMGINVLWFQRDKSTFLPPEIWSSTSIATTNTHDMATVAGWWQGHDFTVQKLSDKDLKDGLKQRQKDRAHLASALQQSLPDSAISKTGLEPDFQPDSVSRVVDAAIAFVSASPAPLTIIPVEDLLGEPDQPNLPGCSGNVHPNWRRRLPGLVKAIFNNPDVKRRIGILNKPVPTPSVKAVETTS